MNLDKLLYAAFGIYAVLTIAAVSLAFAYSPQVKKNCTNDYFAHCSHTTPYSQEMRVCMGKAGESRLLSKPCLQALKSSGEVSKWQRARN